ncbi:MAG: Txe/YoeB family addiction module toxin [Petrimonas sp.]|jgi:toxin YoeB|uniref:Txe/YoeB family addiction module toxin n=1 Tax=Petrimonas TaxID=307628 RepID=UPI001BD304C5|nr:Txe/YoeB family addiction module toxin [Petrimonas sp.]MEA5046250.1 Txe/YoeB family addiction module toxin [Petrimonas sp.]NLU30940.1 Txe/YoeB family addiction module toxin [Bacteroidales bacterium]
MENKEYEIEYTEQFYADVEAHKKSGQKAILIKINSLINELRKHPTTGTGKPEPLQGDRLGQWSRRITSKHRLIYEIKESEITVLVLSGLGHYGDK